MAKTHPREHNVGNRTGESVETIDLFSTFCKCNVISSLTSKTFMISSLLPLRNGRPDRRPSNSAYLSPCNLKPFYSIFDCHCQPTSVPHMASQVNDNRDVASDFVISTDLRPLSSNVILGSPTKNRKSGYRAS